jgi:hypothetical protein
MKNHVFSSVLVSALALGLAACGASSSSGPDNAKASGQGQQLSAANFENPGGMWMPAQMAAHADILKKLGLELDPAMLADPTSSLLQAIVSLGGCSASFVSPDGLIITNHHCVAGALAYHSSPERDLVKDGFLAKTRADELWNGPTSKVWVTQKISDVTPRSTPRSWSPRARRIARASAARSPASSRAPSTR